TRTSAAVDVAHHVGQLVPRRERLAVRLSVLIHERVEVRVTVNRVERARRVVRHVRGGAGAAEQALREVTVAEEQAGAEEAERAGRGEGEVGAGGKETDPRLGGAGDDRGGGRGRLRLGQELRLRGRERLGPRDVERDRGELFGHERRHPGE